MAKPTIIDVAEHSGVSFKTVSRVINDVPTVRIDLRERVLKSIKALNYRPDVTARNLRSTTPFSIGLAYDNPNAYYIIDLQEGILSACRELGYGLQIHPCDSLSKTIFSELIELTRHSRLAGLILAPPISEMSRLTRVLKKNATPYAQIISGTQAPSKSSPCVFVNDRAAALEVTEHLFELGHTRIGFLWGDASHKSSDERFEGYKLAHKKYGTPISKRIVLAGAYTFESGVAGGLRLLQRTNRPTAIVCSNDEIAAGALAAANQFAVRVPEQLSITGFEDSPFSRHSHPRITTAKQSTHEIARQAAVLLIGELRRSPKSCGAVRPKAVGLTPRLIIRESTGPAPT